MTRARKYGISLIYAGFLLLSGALQAVAQDSEKEPNMFLNGYLKNMVISDFSLSDSTFWTNLVHNRLNFKWYPGDKWSVFVEQRTRWYYGDYVEIIPGFEQQLDITEDYFNLSWTIASSNNSILHTMVDRAFVSYQSGDWEAKFGRQRINWGVNTVWNPNDLFNAFSFIDFDYEERPGADALRIQKYTGFASSIDVAANMAERLEDFTAAARWSTNKSGYDFQAVGGLSRRDIAVGGAWAGNLKRAGFKGEFTMFLPVADNPRNEAFVGTLSYDYSFKSSFYFILSYLYNSDGGKNLNILDGFGQFYFGQLTARDLTPYMHNGIALISYQFHPLIFGSLAVMAFPGNTAMFVNPTVTFSLLTNFDLDIIGQSFYGDVNGDFRSVSKVAYFRLKWSF